MGSTLFCSVLYHCQIKEISRQTQWRSSSPPYFGRGLASPLQVAVLEKLSYYKYKEGEI